MSREVTVFSVGGFTLVLPSPQIHTLDELRRSKAYEWQIIMVPRRVVSFSHMFKIITDYCKEGTWFVRTRFSEQFDKPIDAIITINEYHDIVIHDAFPGRARLMRRILSGPRYSNAFIFLVNIGEPGKTPRWISDLAKIAKKTLVELSPLMYSRGLGRLRAVRVVENEDTGETSIYVCVEREKIPVSSTRKGNIQIYIAGIEKCLGEHGH